MSILNDSRIISDDIWAYTEWLNEVKREFRGVDKCPTPPDEEEETEEKDDKGNDIH